MSEANPNDLTVAAEGTLIKGPLETMPATLIVHRDRISITGRNHGAALELPRENVSSVQQPFFFPGRLRIAHQAEGQPSSVTFLTDSAKADRIVNRLESFGYRIENIVFTIPGGSRQDKFRWRAVLGPGFAAVMAFVSDYVYAHRLLPSLKSPTILSGGRMVPTPELAESFARMFFRAGVSCVILALGISAFQLWRMRRPEKLTS